MVALRMYHSSGDTCLHVQLDNNLYVYTYCNKSKTMLSMVSFNKTIFYLVNICF